MRRTEDNERQDPRRRNPKEARGVKAAKPIGLESRLKKGLLTARDMEAVIAGVTSIFPTDVLAMMKGLGVDPETTIRLSLLGLKCRERRRELGWALKQAAERLGVPRYRIKAIESGSHKEMSQKEVHLYVTALDILDWFEKWRRANRRVFASLPADPDRDTAWARKVRGAKV